MVDAGGNQAGEEFVEIDVVRDDSRGLPSELERYAGDAFGTQAHDSSTRGGASGEGDLVDVAMSDEMLTDFAAGGYDADHAFGELCGFEGFGEHHRAHWPPRRRPYHDRASRRERARGLPLRP